MKPARIEKTLEEVVYEHSIYSRSVREYVQITHAIRMLRDSSWWQFYRKHQLKNILIKALKDIEDDTPASMWASSNQRNRK